MAQIFLISAAAAILQLTAVNYIKGSFPVLNLPLLVLVFFGFRKGFKVGAGLGVFFGIFIGFFNISPFWNNIFLYAAIGSGVGYISRWFYKENIFSFLLMIFCAEVFIYLFYYISRLGPSNIQLNPLDYTFRLFFPAAVCNMGVSIFLFYFLKRAAA